MTLCWLTQFKDVDMGSTWQTSLEYLRESRENWPVSYNFLRLVPKEEMRSKFYDQVNIITSIQGSPESVPS